MNAPAVAVVVPTYNRAAMLDRLLGALDEQLPVEGGHEVVVVDDGSNDGTPAVVARHPGVRYERQANAGPAAARNRGWRSTAAPVIAFTDDDTVPTPTWLRELLAAIDDGHDGVGGRIVPLEPGVLADFVGLEGHVGHGVEASGEVRYLVTADAAWRRDVLEALGGFDESFAAASGEDTDLTMRARTAGYSLAVVPGAVVAHDHRATVGNILRTYHQHGRSRHLVVAANPGYEWGARTTAMLRPRWWVDRFRRYQRAAGSPRAALYVLLRAVGSVAYGTGILRSRWR